MVILRYGLLSLLETKALQTKVRYYEPFLFREKLYVYDENGKRIGRFGISCEQQEFTSTFDEGEILKIYVHISNRACIDGRLTESTVTGTVSNRLRTLEEIRYECTEVPGSGKHERILFLLRERTKYYYSVTNTICGVSNRTQSTLSFTESVGMVGECSNIIILRQLAAEGIEGIFGLKTILSNGKECKNYYVSRLSEQVVNGKKMQVLVVYRCITNHKKYNVTMTMALTRTGQIIYLFWSNSKYFLHIDPDVELQTNVVKYGQADLVYHWHNDIQLHSIYHDEVGKQMIFTRSFKYRKEQLRRILGDFVEYVLLMKPVDPICFAIRFFSSYDRDTMTKCRSKEKLHPKETSEEVPSEEEDDRGTLSENFPFWVGEDIYFEESEMERTISESRKSSENKTTIPDFVLDELNKT